jgi:hypothetical protein
MIIEGIASSIHNYLFFTDYFSFMEYKFSEIASRLKELTKIKGVDSVVLSLQYFEIPNKDVPSLDDVKAKTKCEKIKDEGCRYGIIAENCKGFPEEAGNCYASALYAEIKGAGTIALFSGHSKSDISPEPCYSWRTREEGEDETRARIDDTLRRDLKWRKADEMFYHTTSL